MALLKQLSSIFSNPTLTSAKPHHQNIGLSRRDFINVGLSVMSLVISPPPPSIAREVEVGSFLPPSPTDPNFVLFKAAPKDTPALRAEPWVEVKFEDEKQGKVQVVASPLIRLTNKPNATIEDIGTPEKVIASLGPFVTGNTLDPDELIETSIEKRGDLTYYRYVLETPYALTGSHNLAKATAKGNTVVLCVVSANDKQWALSQKTLQAILDSFEV